MQRASLMEESVWQKMMQALQIRNVVERLPEGHQFHVRQKMQCAYRKLDYSEARRVLDLLLREPMDLNPSAARSLEEGAKRLSRFIACACRRGSVPAWRAQI